MSEDTVLIAFSTFECVEDAKRVVRTLVSERLAACGTFLPGAISIYQWKNELQETQEVQVLFKTQRSKVDSLKSRLVELHPYETPEFFAVSAEHLHPPYAEWVAKALS